MVVVTAPMPFVGPQFDAESLCAEIDPEVWFPEQGGSNALAKALCARCENEDACLTWALENGEVDWGIFGGKSPSERKKLLRERDRQQRRPGGPPKPIRHGTEGGMAAHRRRGEVVPGSDPCGCRRAAALARAEREKRRGAA